MTLAANADALSLLNTQISNLGVTNTTQAATILDLTTRLAAATATHQAYHNMRNPRNNNNNNNNNEHRNPGAPRQYCWTHSYCNVAAPPALAV